ncbi:MAG: GNAT family N-acetyltransferase [Sporolactobacillus sp.]
MRHFEPLESPNSQTMGTFFTAHFDETDWGMYPFISDQCAQRKQGLSVMENEEVVGSTLLVGNTWENERHTARLVIIVRPLWRRKGIGRQLLQKAEELAGQLDIWRLEVLLSVHDRASLLFFGTSGFQVEGIKRAAFSRSEEVVDGFYMAKILK